jgi:hypothetical protein
MPLGKLTNTPKFVTPLIVPWNDSPAWSFAQRAW